MDVKNHIIPISVGSLIALAISLVSATNVVNHNYSEIDKRITIIEQKQERKAEKEDIKILDIRLKSIETTLLEIKQDLQKK